MENFRGNRLLFGEDAFEKIIQKKIAIIGLGGVGSWAVEALARFGFKQLTLIDLDEICYSNINRQIHALNSTVGKSKALTLKERILDINKEAHVEAILDFITPTNMEELLSQGFDLIIDAIDSLGPKVSLLSYCRDHKIKIITVGGAGGRKDITKITVDDLGRTINDKFLMRVRKKLKRDHNFPKFKDKKFNIPCVYSTEIIDEPCEDQTGRACDTYLGSLSYITGTMGFYLAWKAVEVIHSEVH